MTAGMGKCPLGHFLSSKRNGKRSMSITCEQTREDGHLRMDCSLLPTCFYRKRMSGEGSSLVSTDTDAWIHSWFSFRFCGCCCCFLHGHVAKRKRNEKPQAQDLRLLTPALWPFSPWKTLYL